MQKIWTYCLALLLGILFVSASPKNSIVTAPFMETFLESELISKTAASPSSPEMHQISAESKKNISTADYSSTISSAQEVSSQPPPDQGVQDTVTQNNSSDGYYLAEIPLSQQLQYYTYQQCSQKQVSYDLVLAMMFHESSFDPNAMNYYADGSTDSGLMQINSINAETLNELYGITNLCDPYENIEAGVSIISGFVNQYGENDGLMAYNMGAGGYQDALANGITTTDYAQKILATKSDYERLRGRL